MVRRWGNDEATRASLPLPEVVRPNPANPAVVDKRIWNLDDPRTVAPGTPSERIEDHLHHATHPNLKYYISHFPSLLTLAAGHVTF